MIRIGLNYPQANRLNDQGQLKLQCLYCTVLGQVRLRRSLRSAIGQVDHMLGQVRLLRRSLRSAIGPNYPQANRWTGQSCFKNSLMQLHYVRLGQVRLRRSLRSAIGQVDHMLGQVRLLRRSLRSQSVPTILRPIGRLISLGLKFINATPLCQVRLGQVKAVPTICNR